MKRYIGNKRKLVGKIEEFIQSNHIEAETFIDLYSGTGSVASYFRSKYRVTANDIMNYSFVVLKAKLSFNGSPQFKDFISKFEKDPIDVMNELTPHPDNSMIIWKHFSPQGGRKYFTEKNALKIDAARQWIDKILEKKYISKKEWFYLLSCIITTVNSKGNTTGTFGAYLKSFSNSTLKPIVFSHLEPSFGDLGLAYSEDGKELIKKLKGDILYLDPPYTAIDYSQAYHFLESLSLYDSNEYKGITGRRVINNKVSNYTKKRLAAEEFKETLKNAKKCKNIILSYSTHGIMSLDTIKIIISEFYDEVIVQKIIYSKYRNVFSNDKGKLYELLVLGKGRK